MTEQNSAELNPVGIVAPSIGGRIPWKRVWQCGLLLALIVLGWFYWHAVDNRELGFTHDDGVYVVTGQGLATGNGFRLMHVVGHPPEVKYPFVYPAILSLVWRVNPNFPDNLPLMNAVTVFFTLLGAVLIFIYLTRYHRFPGWVALLVIGAVTTNFFFIYFYTSVMSEAPYLVFSLLTLCLAGELSRRHGVRWPVWGVVALAVLSAITFLTRIPGLTLMAAIGTWLLMQRQWRNMFLYGALAFVLGVLPWFVWVKNTTVAITPLNFPLINAYSNYGFEFAHNYTANNYFAGLQNDCFILLNKLLEDMFPLLPNLVKIYPQLKQMPDFLNAYTGVLLVSVYLLAGYFVLQLISMLRKTTQDHRFHSQAFSIPALYLTYYMIVITLWNYEDQFTRFLVVVTPLLWLYFFKPFLVPIQQWAEATVRTNRLNARAMVATVGLLVCTALAMWTGPNSYHIIATARQQHWVESGKAKWLWGEYENSFEWIRRSLPPDAPIAAASDVVYYLYTGRPTFYVFYASLPRLHGKFTKDAIPRLQRSLDHYGVKYLVAEPHMQFRTLQGGMNKVAKQLIDANPKRYQLIYSTPRNSIQVFQILPAS